MPSLDLKNKVCGKPSTPPLIRAFLKKGVEMGVRGSFYTMNATLPTTGTHLSAKWLPAALEVDLHGQGRTRPQHAGLRGSGPATEGAESLCPSPLKKRPGASEV